MKRKGNAGVEPLLILALIISFLSVAGISYYLISSDQLGFLKLIPGFNNTKETVKTIEILRYDILENKIQHYDGSSWLDFSSPIIQLGDRKVSEEAILNAFKNYWYDSPRPDISLRDHRIPIDKYNLFASSNTVLAGSSLEPYKISLEERYDKKLFRGYIFVYLVSSESESERARMAINYIDKFFVVKSYSGTKAIGGVLKGQNSIYIGDIKHLPDEEQTILMMLHTKDYMAVLRGNYPGFSSDYNKDSTSASIFYNGNKILRISYPNSNEEKTIYLDGTFDINIEEMDSSHFSSIKDFNIFKQKIISWRDSILTKGTNAKALKLEYEMNSREKRSFLACVNKYDGRYLIVDFKKEVSSDADCK